MHHACNSSILSPQTKQNCLFFSPRGGPALNAPPGYACFLATRRAAQTILDSLDKFLSKVTQNSCYTIKKNFC